MSGPSLTVNFSGISGTDTETDAWVRLEQIMPSAASAGLSLRDVHRMWLQAATGASASLMRLPGCPVRFVGSKVQVVLGLYAWPSDPALAFSVTAAVGVITGPVMVEIPRQFSALVDNSAVLPLGFFMSAVSLEWESPCFTADGTEISPPAWRLENGNTIRFAAPIFAVVRITGIAHGCHYNSVMEFDKPVTEDPDLPVESPYPEGYLMVDVPAIVPRNSVRVSNIDNTVTASWQDNGATETDQLRLEIPQCVLDILSLCPDMFQIFILLCTDIHTLYVYFNACESDEILKVRVSGVSDDAEDTTTICSDISGQSGVTASPWGVLAL